MSATADITGNDLDQAASAIAEFEGPKYSWLCSYLRVCEFAWWHEPNYALGLLDEEWAHWYPITVGELKAPPALYDELVENYSLVREAIEVKGALDEFKITPDHDLVLAEDEPGVAPDPPALRWRGLRFRSRPELEIAKALDRAGVAFTSNALTRVGDGRNRVGLEVDLLVCEGGRCGVIEVDGGPFHPPERSAIEHRRDRRFRKHGMVVERFDADDCRRDPDGVVAEFLRTLRAPA